MLFCIPPTHVREKFFLKDINYVKTLQQYVKNKHKYEPPIVVVITKADEACDGNELGSDAHIENIKRVIKTLEAIPQMQKLKPEKYLWCTSNPARDDSGLAPPNFVLISRLQSLIYENTTGQRIWSACRGVEELVNFCASQSKLSHMIKLGKAKAIDNRLDILGWKIIRAFTVISAVFGTIPIVGAAVSMASDQIMCELLAVCSTTPEQSKRVRAINYAIRLPTMALRLAGEAAAVALGASVVGLAIGLAVGSSSSAAITLFVGMIELTFHRRNREHWHQIQSLLK